LKNAFLKDFVAQAKTGNNPSSSAVFRIPVSLGVGAFGTVFPEFCYTSATQKRIAPVFGLVLVYVRKK
jgi:hypothetical protein